MQSRGDHADGARKAVFPASELLGCTAQLNDALVARLEAAMKRAVGTAKDVKELEMRYKPGAGSVKRAPDAEHARRGAANRRAGGDSSFK